MLLKSFVFGIAIISIIALLQLGMIGNVDLHEKLLILQAKAGIWGWPIFCVVCVVFTSIGGARQIVALACGALIGGVSGAFISTLLTTIGALLTILFIRFFGGDWFIKKYQRKIWFLSELLKSHTWAWICAIRLLPVGSNLLTNIAAAVSFLPLPSVLFGSFVGYLPQMFLFSFIGAGVAQEDTTKLWLSIVLFIVSSLMGSYLYKHGVKDKIIALKQQDMPNVQ